MRDTARRLLSALAFGGSIAAVVIVLGTRDLESYEHVFFSLDRGTAVDTVRVLGQPVFTLGLGLGVRLPLQANLGASPVAALAPFLPIPATYWLLLAFSVAAAVIVVRHALEPIAGRLVAWAAAVLLFCSPPLVTYTIYNDWPEVAVTYCAFVCCVFAPHALIALLDTPRSRRRTAGVLSLAALVWALVALAHPGYWPLLAAAIVCSHAVALCRSDCLWRARLTAVAVLAAASLLAALPQVPDILRELGLAGAALSRYTEGPAGSLVAANLFPLTGTGPRLPFTYLVLALIALAVGVTSEDADAKRLIAGRALASIALGVVATAVFGGTAPYAPSNVWALRDPAAAFAILSAACAARVAATRYQATKRAGAGAALAALLAAGAQGPAYAVHLMFTNVDEVALNVTSRQWRESLVWTRDMSAPGERALERGLARDRMAPAGRLALWPGVRGQMRNGKRASTDFADAGYPLVTAWTKQRTMRALVEPNDQLFNQAIELAPDVLCDARTVAFLQLRYLLIPAHAECAPWRRLHGVRIDGWLDVAVATESDARARAVPVSTVSRPSSREPALSAGSALPSLLVALRGTSVDIGPIDVRIGLDDPAIAAGHILVLPVAYDAAWTPSSGRVESVGGLLALVGVDQREVTLEFVPDLVAVLRAVSMSVAQIFAIAGFVGLAYVRPVVRNVADQALTRHARDVVVGAARRAFAFLRPALHPRNWLYLAYAATVGAQLEWRPPDSDATPLATGLALPVTALTVAYLAQHQALRRAVGAALLAAGLFRIAAGGSLSAYALQDPLFWGAIAIAGAAGAAMTGRWPAVALAASFLSAACLMVAILIPVVPLPGVGARFFSDLSDQIGTTAAVLLLGIWLQALTAGGMRGGRIAAGARGALLAALVLVLARGVPTAAGIDWTWMAVFGVLVGLAEAHARVSASRA